MKEFDLVLRIVGQELALMGVGCGGGHVTVTDMDSIEVLKVLINPSLAIVGISQHMCCAQL